MIIVITLLLYILLLWWLVVVIMGNEILVIYKEAKGNSTYIAGFYNISGQM